MNMRPLLIANIGLIVGMAAFSAWAWNLIPDGAQVPVHWNIEGHADRYGSKVEALLAMPAVAAVLTALLLFLPRIDPRRANIEASGKFWNAVAIAIVALLAYVHVFLILNAMGRSVDVLNGMIPGLCALFVVIGNYLSKTRSNWFAGVRTPWTLSSEYSWEKTHRWTGRLFVATGIVDAVVWLAAGPRIAMGVLLASLLATTIAAIALSYVFWKNDPDRIKG
jgi:uncharacterized membrane protein